MTQTQLADAAGMAEKYVASVEDGPVRPNEGQIMRLAVALHTDPATLLGEDIDLPPGRQQAAPHARLETLGEDECWQLVGQAGIGRLALTPASDLEPVVLPMNYRIDDHSVLLRTEPGNIIDTTVDQGGGACPAAFEIDRIDEAEREGWSVLLRGRAERTPSADDDPHPWAGGARTTAIRLTPRQISGRRIRAN